MRASGPTVGVSDDIPAVIDTTITVNCDPNKSSRVGWSSSSGARAWNGAFNCGSDADLARDGRV